jgi:hypothetical protein
VKISQLQRNCTAGYAPSPISVKAPPHYKKLSCAKSNKTVGRKGLQRKSFWHSQKIEAESPVFCEAKKAHGKNWCTLPI